jgi:tyrosinase
MVTRKNQSSLTVSERAEYVNALKTLKKSPSQFNPPTTSRYDDFVYVHMQAMLIMKIIDRTKPVRNGNVKVTSDMRMPMWAHRCPAFFPWHRELLHQLESELQKAAQNPNLAIPYWDWSVDQSKNAAPWTNDFMGGDGADGPVTTGPFAGKTNWELSLSEDGVDHLVRGLGRDPMATTLPTPQEVSQALNIAFYDKSPWSDRKSLGSFRNQTEGWHVPPGSPRATGMHNLVHVWVGGTQGTMLASTSPNDPVFFLHHCNVDRLWAQWQAQHSQVAPYLPKAALPGDPGQAWNEPMIFYDKTLSSTPPWPGPAITPHDVVDHHQLGYRYDSETTSLRVEEITVEEKENPETDPLKQRPLKISPRDHFRRRLEELSSGEEPKTKRAEHR